MPAKAIQLDMFPPARRIETLDPRGVIGPRTRVEGLYRVRYDGSPVVHQVYRDRHGWYCGDHGPGCEAVADAIDATRAPARAPRRGARGGTPAAGTVPVAP